MGTPEPEWQGRLSRGLATARVHCSPTLTVYFRSPEPAECLRQAAEWLAEHPEDLLVGIGVEMFQTDEDRPAEGLTWEAALTVDPGPPAVCSTRVHRIGGLRAAPPPAALPRGAPGSG